MKKKFLFKILLFPLSLFSMEVDQTHSLPNRTLEAFLTGATVVLGTPSLKDRLMDLPPELQLSIYEPLTRNLSEKCLVAPIVQKLRDDEEPEFCHIFRNNDNVIGIQKHGARIKLSRFIKRDPELYSAACDINESQLKRAFEEEITLSEAEEIEYLQCFPVIGKIIVHSSTHSHLYTIDYDRTTLLQRFHRLHHSTLSSDGSILAGIVEPDLLSYRMVQPDTTYSESTIIDPRNLDIHGRLKKITFQDDHLYVLVEIEESNKIYRISNLTDTIHRRGELVEDHPLENSLWGIFEHIPHNVIENIHEQHLEPICLDAASPSSLLLTLARDIDPAYWPYHRPFDIEEFEKLNHIYYAFRSSGELHKVLKAMGKLAHDCLYIDHNLLITKDGSVYSLTHCSSEFYYASQKKAALEWTSTTDLSSEQQNQLMTLNTHSTFTFKKLLRKSDNFLYHLINGNKEIVGNLAFIGQLPYLIPPIATCIMLGPPKERKFGPLKSLGLLSFSLAAASSYLFCYYNTVGRFLNRYSQ